MRIACFCPRHRRVSSGRVWQGFFGCCCSQAEADTMPVLCGAWIPRCACCRGGDVAGLIRGCSSLQESSEVCSQTGAYVAVCDAVMFIRGSLRCSSESCFVALLSDGLASLRSADHARAVRCLALPRWQKGGLHCVGLESRWRQVFRAVGLRPVTGSKGWGHVPSNLGTLFGPWSCRDSSLCSLERQ
jgi:hypothetical protein